MNLSEDIVQFIDQSMESIVRNNVTDIQGQYYETYD